MKWIKLKRATKEGEWSHFWVGKIIDATWNNDTSRYFLLLRLYLWRLSFGCVISTLEGRLSIDFNLPLSLSPKGVNNVQPT